LEKLFFSFISVTMGDDECARSYFKCMDKYMECFCMPCGTNRNGQIIRLGPSVLSLLMIAAIFTFIMGMVEVAVLCAVVVILHCGCIMFAGNATRPVEPEEPFSPVGYRVETPDPNEHYVEPPYPNEHHVENPGLAYRREGEPEGIEQPASTACAPASTSMASAPARAQVPIERSVPNYSENKQPAVLVLPHWWETQMDNNGRVYYKNNYKQTTSWTAPTAEQIAQETQERAADARITTEGTAGAPPPPAYHQAPPYY